jgi:DNA-binding MarR family transcriptional regulator
MASVFDRNEQHINQRAKIIAGIERLSTVFRAALWEEAKQYNLSPLQVQILLFISFHHAAQCSVTSLAREFAVTKATISDAVKILLEKDLLKKIPGGDPRGFLLALSATGAKYADSLSGLSDFFTASLDNVPQAEINKIWEGMLLLIGHLQKSDMIPMRMCHNCEHFGKEHPGGTPHFCKLMQKPLATETIRLNCPEHLAVQKLNAGL